MSRTLFRDVRVIDGTGTAPFAADVLVEGNRIKEIGQQPRRARRAPTVVDGGGATLMPGLVEAHAHLTFLDTRDLESLGVIPPEEHTLLTMKNAKTAARPRLHQLQQRRLRQAAARRRAAQRDQRRRLPGPRMLAATPEMTVTAGLGDVRLITCIARLSPSSATAPRSSASRRRELRARRRRHAEDQSLGRRVRRRARARTHRDDRSRDRRRVRGRAARTTSASRRTPAAPNRSRCALRHGVDSDLPRDACSTRRRSTCWRAPRTGSSSRRPSASPTRRSTRRATAASRRRSPSACGMRRELEHRASRHAGAARSAACASCPGGDYGFAWNPHGRNARDIEHFVNLLGFTPMEAIVVGHQATAARS